jgi:large repetitive protein
MSGYDLAGIAAYSPCGSSGDSGMECVHVVPQNLNNGQVGVPYSQDVFVSGGFPPYIWDQFAATWPAGITQDTGTGTISGTPTTAGTTNIILKCRDLIGGAGWQAVTLTIDP